MKKVQAIVYSDGTFDTIEDYHKKQSKEWEYLQRKKSDEESYRFIDDNFGSFYFNNYNKLLAKNLESQMLFRFTYLCTFLDYENNLRYGASNGIMLEKDLQEVLKLSERETRNTKNALIKTNLLLSQNKELSINKNFCSKGETKKLFTEKGVIRMFEEGIKKLYEGSQPRDHKKVGVLLKILPYLHIETNVLCHNPNEEDIELIKPLTLTEMANILGFSTTQKLKKGLFDLKIDDTPVIMNSIINNVRKIVVNPQVYYKGSNIEQMKGLINLFKVGNKI